MKFAVIDIECTGGTWGQERIIDVAVFVLEDGEVIDQFVSLVNPEASIDPYVSKLTGITNKMVRTAPKFFEIAKRLVKVTEDCTFVAHNISFDYRVFQQEFATLGFDYHRATFHLDEFRSEGVCWRSWLNGCGRTTFPNLSPGQMSCNYGS